MINQITKIRLPDGSEVALTDWSDKPLYSTVELFDGFTDTEIYAFTYVEGGRVSASQNLVAAGGSRVATKADTNAPSAGEMPATQEFLGYAVSVEAFTTRSTTVDRTARLVTFPGYPSPYAAQLANLSYRLLLELEISQKDFPLAGLGWFTTGFGLHVTSGRSANLGFPHRDAVYFQSIPYHIGGTEKYKVIFHNPPGTPVQFFDDQSNPLNDDVVVLRTYLVGFMKRSAG